MHTTRRVVNGARNLDPPGRMPVLLLLRGAIALLALLAFAAGAVPADPAVRQRDAKPPAATPERDSDRSATSVRRKRSVFVCDDAGIPVFSDRPCGPDLVHRSISLEHSSAGKVASTLPPVPEASTRPRVRNVARGDEVNRHAERCTALRRQLADLDDRMRTGYSSREAAKLWERRRGLKDDLRSARC